MDTTQDPTYNRVRQVSIFLANRLGALLSALRALEAQSIVVRAISIVEAADHAVARLIVDQPTLAATTLRHAGYCLVETDVLGVALPNADEVPRLLKALLMAEVNVHYLYSLLAPSGGKPLLVVHAEDAVVAARVLCERRFQLVDQADLQ